MNLTLPSGLLIEEEAPLAPFTSWLVGGPAEFFVRPRTERDLEEALIWARQRDLPVTVLSGGTNVLVSDQGIRGLVVNLRKMTGTMVTETTGEDGEPRLMIECLAGTSKSELLKIFLKHRLEPALFLAGLPGDVGGGVVMNAGIGENWIPREFVEITDWIEVMRWDESEARPVTVRLASRELQWSYRHCEGWRPGVIVRVGLSWPSRPVEDILGRVKQANQWRLGKQPLDLPSCGSVFVNPPGHKSGQLIESCGLKGFAIGGAKISERHGNFIVNFRGATANDIKRLISHAQATVLARTGVHLKTEVVAIGGF